MHRHPPTCTPKRFAPRHYLTLHAAPVAAAGSRRRTSMFTAATCVTSGLRQAPHTSSPRGPGLTSRSSRAPTAGHQARAGGTRYIFASPGLASHRRCRLSSNVRRRKTTYRTSMEILDLLIAPGAVLGCAAGVGAAAVLQWLFPDQDLVFVQSLLVIAGGAIGAIIEHQAADTTPKR